MGADPFYRIRADHPDEIDGVDSEVEKGSSTKLRFHDPVLVLYAVGKSGTDLPDPSYLSIGDQPADDVSCWLVTGPYCLGYEDMLFLGQVQDGFCLGSIGHEGLLNKARLALP